MIAASGLNRRVKVFLLQKEVCLAASLTDITDTKEEDSLFSHRYLCPAPSTSPCSKQSPVSSSPRLGELGFKRGTHLHLPHCQSESASEFQAFRCRANQ